MTEDVWNINCLKSYNECIIINFGYTYVYLPQTNNYNP